MKDSFTYFGQLPANLTDTLADHLGFKDWRRAVARREISLL